MKSFKAESLRARWVCMAMVVLGASLSLPSKATATAVSWIPINNGLTDLFARTIQVNPADSTQIVATTLNSGVFISTDRGASWSASNSGLTTLATYTVSFDSTTPSTLFLGHQNGVSKSTNSGASWGPSNSGRPSRWVGAIAVDPTNGNRVYAGPDAFGIYRTLDGGASWTSSGGGRDVRQFAIDSTNPGTAFASTVQGVLKTTNGGDGWFSVSAGLTSSFVFGLEIDPSDSSVLYASPADRGVYKTIDGGANWFAATSGMPLATVLDFAIDPTATDTVYAAVNQNGIFRTRDGGVSWEAINAGLTNLAGTQAVVIDPQNPNRVYASTYGGGIFLLVPEPNTALLLGLSLAGIAVRRRRAKLYAVPCFGLPRTVHRVR